MPINGYHQQVQWPLINGQSMSFIECFLPMIIKQFVNVSNVDELMNVRDMALIDSRMIISEFHLLSAIEKARILNRTKNIYSEILYSLSPNRSISQSFATFGLKQDCTSLFAVATNKEQLAIIRGVETELTFNPNVEVLRKAIFLMQIYNCQIDDLESIAISAMALQ